MESKKRRVRMMGTVIDLLVEHETPELILNELVERLTIYENRFSANDTDSELMEINLNAGIKSIKVHPDLFNLIKIGKHQSCVEESLLNIALGPLVQTWRIGFKDAKVPSDKRIKSLLKLTHPQNITLDQSTYSVFLQEKGMLIDLGALAKGYIADLLIDYLNRANVKSAMINLGGNIVVLGESIKHPRGYWRIGIQNPNKCRKENIAILEVKNQSIVTSGIYERHLDCNGKSYHHIFDPKTGHPTETDIASITIVSDSSLDGEIWTTRLFGKQSNEALDIVNQLNRIECLIVTVNGEILKSNLLK